MPLELFVFVGTFIEELIFPIPSLLVLIPAGAAAEVQGFGLWYLALLAIISAGGRVLGAAVLYWFSDKIEDALLSKGRRLFGYSHDDIERLGSRLSGTKKDWFILFALNVAPGVPPVIPIACGFLKVRFDTFVTATFFGNIFSTGVLLYAGYAGLQVVKTLHSAEVAGQIFIGLIAAAVAVWVVRRYQKKTKKQSKPDKSPAADKKPK